MLDRETNRMSVRRVTVVKRRLRLGGRGWLCQTQLGCRRGRGLLGGHGKSEASGRGGDTVASVVPSKLLRLLLRLLLLRLLLLLVLLLRLLKGVPLLIVRVAVRVGVFLWVLEGASLLRKRLWLTERWRSLLVGISLRGGRVQKSRGRVGGGGKRWMRLAVAIDRHKAYYSGHQQLRPILLRVP